MGRTTWEESFPKAAKNKTEWDRLGTLANTAKGSTVLLSGRSEVRVLSGVPNLKTAGNRGVFGCNCIVKRAKNQKTGKLIDEQIIK